MILSKENIIKICVDNLNSFENVVKRMNFEIKGIFNSEMLLFISLANHLGVKLIIESGRANGQSTKVLAENFKNPDYKIISIEFNKYSSDVKYSYERLKKYKNLKLLFGNSFNLIPKFITEECFILIDGPKRIDALKLAVESLKNSLVKAVFIHDLHKDSPHREDAEKLFSNYFYTDDEDYVKKFKKMDKQCWLDQLKYRGSKSWGPYRRGNRIMKSYSSTLLVVLNNKNPFDKTYYENLLKKKKSQMNRKWSLKYIIDGWPSRLKKIVIFPIHYLYFEKIFMLKNKINFLDLLKNWIIMIYSNFASIFKKRDSFYKEELD